MNASSHSDQERLLAVAARFLPAVALPTKQEASSPEAYADEVARLRERPDGAFMSTWDVMCVEAVERAKVLLAAARGEIQSRVEEDRVAWRQEHVALAGKRRELDLRGARYAKHFPSGAADANDDFLRLLMPQVKRKATRATYWRFFREGMDPAARRFFTLPLERHRFEALCAEFAGAYEWQWEEWKKRAEQAGGKRGATKKGRTSKKQA